MAKNLPIQPTLECLECEKKMFKIRIPKFTKQIFLLKRLQSKKMDIYLRGESDYIHEDWLAKSVPTQMESVVNYTSL